MKVDWIEFMRIIKLKVVFLGNVLCMNLVYLYLKYVMNNYAGKKKDLSKVTQIGKIVCYSYNLLHLK